MNFPKVFSTAAESLAANRFVKILTNDPAKTLMGFGTVSMVGGAVLCYQAAKKIDKEIDGKDLSKKEKAKVYAKHLWVPVSLLVTAEGLFLYSYKISKEEIESLKEQLGTAASAAAISSIAAQELKKAMNESLDPEKVDEIQEKADAKTKERAKEELSEKNIVKNNRIVYNDIPDHVANQNWLIRDAFTGLVFESSISRIIGIVNKLNMEIIEGYDNVEAVRFYELLGIPVTPIMEGRGWGNFTGMPDQIEVEFEPTLTENNVPYIEMRFTPRGEPRVLVC